MKLLVLGATGDIGEAVLMAAVTAGHDVTAFVRSPDKLGDVRDRLKVIKGDLTDAAALASALDDTDAVISAIGSSLDKAQLDAPATAVRLILAAMGSAGVRRFVGKLHGFQVTRGDLATAMVTLATGSAWLRQAPYVSESRQR